MLRIAWAVLLLYASNILASWDDNTGGYSDGYPACGSQDSWTYNDGTEIRKISLCSIRIKDFNQLPESIQKSSVLKQFAGIVISPLDLIKRLTQMGVTQNDLPEAIDALSAGYNTSQWLQSVGVLVKKR